MIPLYNFVLFLAATLGRGCATRALAGASSEAIAVAPSFNTKMHFEHRFQPFCNYVCDDEAGDSPAHTKDGSQSCPDPARFDFAPCNQTQTGNSCTLDGCLGWTQGILPRLVEEKEYEQQMEQKLRTRRGLITNNIDNRNDPIWTSKTTGKQYRVINGGVPQFANLSLHLTTLRETIDDYIPSSEYSGNLVLDFEQWTPLWEQNRFAIDNFHAKIYQEYSLDHLARAHPTWNASRVEATSSKLFEQAAETFFVTTLQTLRALRPRSRVGFYGYPFGHYGDCVGGSSHDTKTSDRTISGEENVRCGYDNPKTGPMYRSLNERLAAVYQSSSALFPSIYLQPQDLVHNETFDVWRIHNQKYVNDTVYESIRVVKELVAPVIDTSIPVIPFYWAFYHNGSTLLLPDDVSMLAENAYVPPYSVSLIQWGSKSEQRKIDTWQSTLGGPRIKAAVDRVEICAIEVCSGHGWCSRWAAYPPPVNGNVSTSIPASIRCICDDGYRGLDCGVADVTS